MEYSTGGKNDGSHSGWTESTINDFIANNGKYIDIYTVIGETNYNTGKLGDALRELGSFGGDVSLWYKDYAYSFRKSGDNDWTWLHRGGRVEDGKLGGIFAF